MLFIFSLCSLLLLLLLHRVYFRRSTLKKGDSSVTELDTKSENNGKVPPDDGEEDTPKKTKPAVLMSNGTISASARKRSSVGDFEGLFEQGINGSGSSNGGCSLPPSPGPDSLLARVYEFAGLIRNADISALPGASYGSYVF